MAEEQKHNIMTAESLKKLQERYDYLLNVKRKDFSFPAGQSAQKRGVPSVSRRGINAECTGLYKILQHIMHE